MSNVQKASFENSYFGCSVGTPIAYSFAEIFVGCGKKGRSGFLLEISILMGMMGATANAKFEFA